MSSDMKNDITSRKYAIADFFIYSPDVHSIAVIGHEDECHYIAVPASGCLHALLQKHGEIIAPETLLQDVWESRGMNVVANTLNQNISILHNLIKSLDYSGEIIKTIPKRGFMIPPEIAVTLIAQTEPMAVKGHTRQATYLINLHH